MLRNDDEIKSTIWLVLFHFFCVAKPLNRFTIRSFGALKKRKIPTPYGGLYFVIIPKTFDYRIFFKKFAQKICATKRFPIFVQPKGFVKHMQQDIDHNINYQLCKR